MTGAEKLIDDKIRQSMTQIQDFFEQKFANMTKVMELKKQLAENQKKLQVLKETGKLTELLEDNSSEITIYQNAVEKKWGSSSSEDDLENTSNEIMDELNNLQDMANVSLVERELEIDWDHRPKDTTSEVRDSRDKQGSVSTPEKTNDAQTPLNSKEIEEDKADRMLHKAEGVKA